MRYVGLWHGGASYAAPYAEDAEYFRSIRHAADAMRYRESHGARYPQRFRYVFRDQDETLTPCAHSDWSGGITLYRITPGMSPEDIREMIERDGYPDRLIEFGPRGGIKVERC